MSEILCEWLNGEVKLSRSVVPGSLSEEFSTGYLLGELLHKYGLQDDFNQFSQSRAANAKLNNFSLLEPTLHLLGVDFNENVAHDIMIGKHGAATKLLYELYIALEKKRKTKLTGVAMEAMRPAVPARLKSVGSVSFRERRIGRRQNEIMARIQAAVIQVPKPSLSHTLKANDAKKLLKKKREAEDTYMEINKFENEIQESLQTEKLQETTLESTAQAATELLPTYSDDEYVRKIQKHLEEDMFSREQREKRRRKMLMEQLIAHETEEEIYQEEQLIYKLMRQSQQERRIAVQLMHVRHEKEVLKQNRIFREKQYEERRLREFQEALDREAALAKQEKIDCEEQIVKERERHEKIASERAQAHYKKHYNICWEVIDQIVDLSTKIGEYRVLTNNKVPLKLICDWKELFFNGKSIYEKASIKTLPSEPSPEQLIELNKMDLLDEKDYGEYKSMTGEWCPTEEKRENISPLNNNILGHVLHRLMDIFYPSKPRSSLPVIPPFPIKGCILGKLFSGKTTCVKFLEKVCNIQVLSVDTLVQEAIQAFLNNEMKTEHNLISQEAESSAKQNKVSILLSVRAQLGAASQKLLKKGKSIPDELLVDILLEAIKYEIIRASPEKGWILDGFPMTVNQARLFEKACTGIDPDEMEAKYVNCGKISLVTNPRTPNKPSVALPAFDVSVLLDISDTTVLKRVASLKCKYANIHSPLITAFVLGIHQYDFCRISGFLDTWPKLENWFSDNQNTLVKVNAETEESIVCKTVKEILIEEIDKKQNKRSVLEESPEEKALPVKPQDLLSPISVTPPQIKPGTGEWIYVDEPLPKEIPDFLVPYWEIVENVYVNTIKTVLRCLRDEQYSMIYYLADIRKNFQDYLKHPDHKQEFVSQWQLDFNSISDDLREDEETKAELHQRVTDLRDLLWDICDKRREEAEQERTDIMNDGWLRDHKGIAINHFFSLMQVEVDRFQDTKRLLHDYYRAMEGKIPTEDRQGFTRLPLLDIVDKEQKEDQNESRRIPLVSYKLPSPETNITKSKSKGTLLKSVKDENSSENVVIAFGKDENVISDTWQTAVTAISDMVGTKATKTRLKLIKDKAIAYVEELTMKAEEAYADMEKWLGARFLAEMSSVEKLIEVGRHHIESSSKIQYEMNLEETDFFISSDVKVIPDPVPPSQVPLIETSESSTLTISQLNTLHKHFLQVAPKGFIQKEVFIDIFIDLINSNLGANYLPDAWMNLTLTDLHKLTTAFSTNTELIDWRRFMLSAAQPWPVPSVTQLLKTLHNFMSVDVAGSGFVTVEYYMQVGLWFNGSEDLSKTKDCTEHLAFDRLGNLLKFFFHLFADTGKVPALLNYSEMLLYFASHSDPTEGVYRALSIATRTYINKKEASLVCETFPYTNTEEDENELLNYRGEGVVSLATLLKVFPDGGTLNIFNRYCFLLKHFIKIYKELGNEDLTPLPVELLLKHPFIQDLIKKYQGYKLHVSIHAERIIESS
uniref:Sperm flagellar 2 n=1 Tax=Phasianus colchicus TaxID=9054 RepID=A0A669QXU8_PHACC